MDFVLTIYDRETQHGEKPGTSKNTNLMQQQNKH